LRKDNKLVSQTSLTVHTISETSKPSKAFYCHGKIAVPVFQRVRRKVITHGSPSKTSRPVLPHKVPPSVPYIVLPQYSSKTMTMDNAINKFRKINPVSLEVNAKFHHFQNRDFSPECFYFQLFTVRRTLVISTQSLYLLSAFKNICIIRF